MPSSSQPAGSISIVCSKLPGLRWGEHTNVHVGVQRRSEVIEVTPGDAASVVFTVPVTVVGTDPYDFHGPFVQGTRGSRFVYLSWGDVDATGAFTMFSRIKLMLSAVPDDIRTVLGAGGRVEACLKLTRGGGGLVHAAVVAPWVTWRRARASEREVNL